MVWPKKPVTKLANESWGSLFHNLAMSWTTLLAFTSLLFNILHKITLDVDDAAKKQNKRRCPWFQPIQFHSWHRNNYGCDHSVDRINLPIRVHFTVHNFVLCLCHPKNGVTTSFVLKAVITVHRCDTEPIVGVSIHIIINQVVRTTSKLFVTQHIERYQLSENWILSYRDAKSKILKIWSQSRFWNFPSSVLNL